VRNQTSSHAALEGGQPCGASEKGGATLPSKRPAVREPTSPDAALEEVSRSGPEKPRRSPRRGQPCGESERRCDAALERGQPCATRQTPTQPSRRSVVRGKPKKQGAHTQTHTHTLKANKHAPVLHFFVAFHRRAQTQQALTVTHIGAKARANEGHTHPHKCTRATRRRRRCQRVAAFGVGLSRMRRREGATHWRTPHEARSEDAARRRQMKI
jgi:hypothetical protein